MKLIPFPCRSHRGWHAIASLAFCVAAGSHAMDISTAPVRGIPSDIAGTWEVIGVHVDTEAARTPRYRPDDVRLTGRIFRFSSGSITSNTPERQDCPSPRIAASLPVAQLIESSMAGRAIAPAAAPTAGDYGLRLPGHPQNMAFTITCNGRLWGAGLGREDGIRGAWLLRLADERLALRWHDETILGLKRVPERSRALPSFDCTKAATNSERAICGSMPLAKLDVSVAQSYKTAARDMQKAGQSALAALKAQQRAWLMQRNRCRSDLVCLEKAMSSRLEAIESMPRDD